ncbi:MAG TPA: S9 family peptidase, partial [Chromatiales bacterium]|nr:S9 family peptidase [Chromatiales bacterium]
AVFTEGVFAAGCSRYGIADLEALVRDTHKFESRYPEQLVAPYPEQKQVYVERSPVHFVARASFPLMIQQGSEDPVVPRNQATAMVEALRKAGKTVDYVEFEGEGHGFKKAENIVASVEEELGFYERVLGLG